MQILYCYCKGKKGGYTMFPLVGRVLFPMRKILEYQQIILLHVLAVFLKAGRGLNHISL